MINTVSSAVILTGFKIPKRNVALLYTLKYFYFISRVFHNSEKERLNFNLDLLSGSLVKHLTIFSLRFVQIKTCYQKLNSVQRN